jgi:serine/threonine protein kinase
MNPGKQPPMVAGARQQTSERSSSGKASPVSHHPEFFQAGREIAKGLRLGQPLGSRRTVWLAHDASGQAWAVKTAPAAVIEHEARILAALSHPHIVRFCGLIRTEAGAVLVVEYLDGGDLVSLAGGPPARWLGALEAVVDALGYLHGQGLVHRDLKARNVLFAADDSARLIDFGSTLRVGSPWTSGGTTVIAPDRGLAPVNPVDDIHALAALAHELLYGAPPLSGGEGARRAVPPSVAPLAAAVDGCLASYANVRAMGLEGFRTVIKSLHERNPGQP